MSWSGWHQCDGSWSSWHQCDGSWSSWNRCKGSWSGWNRCNMSQSNRSLINWAWCNGSWSIASWSGCSCSQKCSWADATAAAEVARTDVIGAEATEVDVMVAEVTEALLYLGAPNVPSSTLMLDYYLNYTQMVGTHHDFLRCDNQHSLSPPCRLICEPLTFKTTHPLSF